MIGFFSVPVLFLTVLVFVWCFSFNGSSLKTLFMAGFHAIGNLCVWSLMFKLLGTFSILCYALRAEPRIRFFVLLNIVLVFLASYMKSSFCLSNGRPATILAGVFCLLLHFPVYFSTTQIYIIKMKVLQKFTRIAN